MSRLSMTRSPARKKRDVAGQPPLADLRHRGIYARFQQVPDRGGGPENGDVCPAVSVVVGRHGGVAVDAKTRFDVLGVTAARLEDVPPPNHMTIDSEIDLTIAVVITRHRNIAVEAPLPRGHRFAGTRKLDVPRARYRPIARNVGLAVEVVGGRHGHGRG